MHQRKFQFAAPVCALGLSIDLAEYGFGSILSAYFFSSGNPDDKSILPWLLSSVYIGAVIGAGVGGILADFFGRRRMFTICMFWIFLTSLGAFFAQDATSLTIMRFISGIFLGAYPPLMSTYLAETTPASKRGRLMMNVVAMGACGPVIIIFLVHFLSHTNPYGVAAWRWGFLVCGIAAFICWLLFLKLPESPKWLRIMGKIQEAEKVEQRLGLENTHPLKPELFALEKPARKPIKIIIFLLTISVIVTWSTIGFPLLIGAMLIAKGINLQSALLFTGFSSAGAVLGVLMTSMVIDKFERKTALLTGGICLGIMIAIFSTVSSPVLLIAAASIFKIFVAMFLPFLTIYATEIVPTTIRGRVTSWTWAARGTGAALAPFFLLPALEKFGILGMSFIILSSIMLFLLIVLIFGPIGEANRQIR